MEDRRIEEEVLAFHTGPEPPLVKHLLMVNLRERRVPAAQRGSLP